MPQLDPTWFVSQLFWLFISFSVLYGVLSRVILPPLMEIMERRKTTIDSDMHQAQSCKTAAEQAKQQYETALSEARRKAQQLIDDAMLTHKAKAEETGKSIDRQVAGKLAEAEKAIANKKQQLTDSLTPATTELASLIVEKLIQRVPTNDKVHSIISELLKVRSTR